MTLTWLAKKVRRIHKKAFTFFKVFFSIAGGDEDFMFGSRNSLSQAKPELDSDEDDDICGSRNSLSGLKRWTTEENLSFTDPRGSRSELMEVPLNDSHSNSTGELYFAISRKKRLDTKM